jgi:hypothetical protein
MNGAPLSQGLSATSGTVGLLEPATTYTFTVEARDNGITWSPPGDPVTATTAPSNPDDVTTILARGHD